MYRTDDKIEAMKILKRPRNIKELQTHLGLVTFYGRFVPNLAIIAHALNQFLKKRCKMDMDRDMQ